MWDIGGQESLRKDWSTYYSTAEVSVFRYFLFKIQLIKYFVLLHKYRWIK